MMNQPVNDQPAPLPNELAVAYWRARRYWQMALFSPPSYLLAMLLLRGFELVPNSASFNFSRFMNTIQGPWWCGGWSTMLCLTVYVTARRMESTTNLRRWWWYYAGILFMSDGAVFLSFIHWYATGHTEPFVITSITAYIVLALTHPRGREFVPATASETD